MTKRCLVMAGGTGGHVFPGLAVAHALQAEGWCVEWLGTAERMEADVVPQHGVPIHFIPVKGLRGKGIVSRLSGLWALVKSIFSARRIIKRVSPDIVIGFGGYASGPGGVAAKTLGIPLVVHEQNAAAGMTNRLLARIAKRVLLGFDDARAQFAHTKAIIDTVGNPVRDAIAHVSPTTSPVLPLNLLVIGGSLGAKALNDILPVVCTQVGNLSVKHQCGKGNVDVVTQAYADFTGEVSVSEFIDDMAQAYQWANVIVCRAGALTVAEVAVAGRAAIFVPLPHAVDDHQTKNANALAKVNAGIVIPQREIESRLSDVLSTFIQQPEQCKLMGAKAKEAGCLHATEKVVNHCKAVIGVGA